MSNDLISRREFKEMLLSYGYLDAAALLEDFSTAYDVDKVVGQPEDSHNKGCLINRNATIQAVEDVLDDENIDYQPCGLGWRIIERIKNMHTAYDVDKVVQQIELLCENMEHDDLNTYEEKTAYNTAYSDALKIVKAGGTK